MLKFGTPTIALPLAIKKCTVQTGCTVCMSSIVYGKTIQKKSYAKMRGRNYVVQTRACSKVSFGSLKRSADYNFRLEFLILPSSGRLKPTCDIRIIHFYYTLEQL